MLGNDGEKYVCCVGSRCTLILANNTGYDCAAMNGTRYLDESSEEVHITSQPFTLYLKLFYLFKRQESLDSSILMVYRVLLLHSPPAV